MTARKFGFSFSVLTGAARRLHEALTDADYQAAMAARLDDDGDTGASNFASRFGQKLSTVETGGISQTAKTGQAGTLTREQQTHLDELDRLVSGARRSARLAFPGDTVKLHSEFQVGIDEPNTLNAQLDRARIVLASCRTHAALLKKQGWAAPDTDSLAAAIENFGGATLAQDEALDERAGLTEAKVTAANALYTDVLRIQNAARLQFPSNKPGNEEARRRFLLDEFPPRDRSEPSGATPATPTPSPSGPPTPPAPKA